MKNAFLIGCLLPALVALGDVPDGGKLQELCNRDRFAKACLAGLLMFRCGRYHTALHALGVCLDRARDAADLIDLKPTTRDSSVQAVAFGGELVRLLADPFTHRYLESTRSAVDEAMRQRTPFDLWGHTVRALGGDTSKALWFLAVLYQDTSPATEHLEYLRDRKPPKVKAEAVATLSELMDLLEPAQLEREQYRTWLRLYPPMPGRAENGLNPSVYHFYTLAYLALRLKWRNADKRHAAFLPFWIEVAYKFKSIDPGRWPLDPGPFSRREHESKLRDMWATFLSTRWAAGLPTPKISWDQFADGMSADPAGFLSWLYRSTLR